MLSTYLFDCSNWAIEKIWERNLFVISAEPNIWHIPYWVTRLESVCLTFQSRYICRWRVQYIDIFAKSSVNLCCMLFWSVPRSYFDMCMCMFAYVRVCVSSGRYAALLYSVFGPWGSWAHKIRESESETTKSSTKINRNIKISLQALAIKQ